jgi:small subunit ribosomal protein S16
MLKIRMQRTGKINQPSYRIVVVEHTASPKAGKFVDKVGTYNPKSKERVLDAERIKHWISMGAQPSATVHNMLVSLGILNAKKINVLPAYKEPVKEEAAAPAEAAVAPAEPAKEAASTEGSGEPKEVAAEAPAQA